MVQKILGKSDISKKKRKKKKKKDIICDDGVLAAHMYKSVEHVSRDQLLRSAKNGDR